ncbi:MAG: 3-oxoacyl-ACP reductase [Desulfobacterales bacterium]|nr:MAG: 3-oxoacyl-ACP reductase [Desulfobacterales bacterium]
MPAPVPPAESLAGRVALVPGAIRGIGLEIALLLAREGCRLVLNYHDWEEDLPAMKERLAAVSAEYLLFKTDLRDTDAAAKMVARGAAHFDRLDILVNNIERGGMPVVHGAYVPEQWDLEQETTLRAKQWIFTAALPFLKASGNGNVINISSISGEIGRLGPASLLFNEGYSAANRGIRLLTETWARLGAPDVRGDEAARAARFLLTDALYMTGALLRLDGGCLLGGEPVHPLPEGVV